MHAVHPPSPFIAEDGACPKMLGCEVTANQLSVEGRGQDASMEAAPRSPLGAGLLHARHAIDNCHIGAAHFTVQHLWIGRPPDASPAPVGNHHHPTTTCCHPVMRTEARFIEVREHLHAQLHSGCDRDHALQPCLSLKHEVHLAIASPFHRRCSVGLSTSAFPLSSDTAWVEARRSLITSKRRLEPAAKVLPASSSFICRSPTLLCLLACCVRAGAQRRESGQGSISSQGARG